MDNSLTHLSLSIHNASNFQENILHKVCLAISGTGTNPRYEVYIMFFVATCVFLSRLISSHLCMYLSDSHSFSVVKQSIDDYEIRGWLRIMYTATKLSDVASDVNIWL